MDLVDAARLVLRQWRVLLLGLVIVGGVVDGMAWRVPPTYSATATVLLLPPQAGGAYQPPYVGPSAQPTLLPKVYNPYLSFDSSLYVLASIVSADLSSDDFKQQLQAGGASASYVVTNSGNQPSVTIVATDGDPTLALNTANALVSAVATDLDERQRPTGIPKENWAVAAPLSLPSHAVATNTKLKVIGIVAGLGILTSISLTFVAESMGFGRRRLRRSPRRSDKGQMAGAGVVSVDRGRTYGRTPSPRITWLVTEKERQASAEPPRKASGQD